MKSCSNCSNKQRKKTVYHIGECPKGWVILPIMPDDSYVDWSKWVHVHYKTKDLTKMRSTRDSLLNELRVAVPGVSFGIREPCEKVYLPPRTLIARIKQVFTGPRMVTRRAEVEISASSTYGLTNRERDCILSAIEKQRSIGIIITVLEFEHGSQERRFDESITRLRADGWL